MPTVSTVPGIETDVRPRFLNAPWSIVLNPVAGKVTFVIFLFTASGFAANALMLICTIPCGIVTSPLQFTPAAEGICGTAFAELT